MRRPTSLVVTALLVAGCGGRDTIPQVSADEIAMQQISVDGYGALVSRIKLLADELCGGRMVFAQEGGYHLTALPWCVRRTVELLCEAPPTPDPLGPIDTPTPPELEERFDAVKRIHNL